jgi:iron-sulfur cluster assembly accessory protein
MASSSSSRALQQQQQSVRSALGAFPNNYAITFPHEQYSSTPSNNQQQKRTMVAVTKTSASDPNLQAQEAQKEESSELSTPAEIPTDVNVDNPAELSVEITPSCVKQVRTLLQKKEKSPEEMFLRVFVDPGGCSGFQYQFELDDELIEEEDFVFESDDGVRVVVDEASLKLIHGSRIDFVQEMIKSAFVVAENPQSESACGCGSSFAVKNFSANPALD